MNRVTPYCSKDVYVLSNEENSEAVQETLSKKKLENPENDAHVGVSGWQNYDLCIAGRSKFLLLVDINGCECLIHELTGKAILAAKDVDDFVSKILEAFKKETRFKIRPEDIDNIQNKKIFWLQTPGGFDKIKKLYNEGKVKIKHFNIADPESANRIVNCLQNNGIQTIHTLYISNVADWLIENPDELRSLDKNVKSLKDKYPSMHVVYSDGTLTKETVAACKYYPMKRKIGNVDLLTHRMPWINLCHRRFITLRGVTYKCPCACCSKSKL